MWRDVAAALSSPGTLKTHAKACKRLALPPTWQPMDEGAEAPQPTAISSSQPHNEGEAIEPAAPAAQLPKQGPDTVAAPAQHAAARPDSLTLATAHSTPAAAAQAVGAAAAAAAAQGTPERSKRSAQAAGLSPRGGSKQQRVDLLLGIGSGPLPSAAQAEQQKAGQPRHCRVCSSSSPGPYASACWHRHPETKEEWLCQPCYGKALRQFRKKQAQHGQNQPAAQQPAGAPAPATAAVVAVQPEAAPPLSEQQPQQAAQAQVHAQKGASGAPPAAEAPAHPPPPPQQLVEAQPAVPRTSLAEPSAAAAAPRPQHSHSGTQTGPTGPVAGAAAEVVPTARAAGADEVAQGAGGEPSQYHLYRQTKQALAACGAPGVQSRSWLRLKTRRLCGRPASVLHAAPTDSHFLACSGAAPCIPAAGVHAAALRAAADAPRREAIGVHRLCFSGAKLPFNHMLVQASSRFPLTFARAGGGGHAGRAGLGPAEAVHSR